MKKKLIIFGVSCIFIIALLFVYKSQEKIKTIKSERQLLNIYEQSEEKFLTMIERILGLPFSLFYDGEYYGKGKYVNDVIMESEKTCTNCVESSSKNDYSKTNVQVEDVDEADIIKTDGNYIYSISADNVVITNVKNPKKVEIVSKINDSSIPNDLLLYKEKLVVISYNNTGNRSTLVKIYDIKDKSKPVLLKSFEIDGSYFTTRCIDGKLYVFSKGELQKNNNKVNRTYKEDSVAKEIPLNKIKYLKDNPTNKQTFIAEVDLSKLDDIHLSSYLVDLSNAYISKDNVYLLNVIYQDEVSLKSLFSWGGVIGFFASLDDTYISKTQIYKFEIDKKKGVVFKATTQVDGHTINQYSLDEKDNNLRIALETDDGSNIAIFDKKLKLLGETEVVAKGEKMYASRFIGDKAYFVTFKNTDPLFVVDLANVRKPKVLGELKIPGYSTYLHPFDENHLIGIGIDTTEEVRRDVNGKVISSWTSITGMKMSLFDISNIGKPKEVSKTTIGDSETSSAILTNPKALLFSKEKNLLAIPVDNYQKNFQIEGTEDDYSGEDAYIDYEDGQIVEGYWVYHVDLDKGFALKGSILHEKEKKDYYNYILLRGVYINNNLFTISENEIKVHKLDDLSEISSLKIKECK